MAPKRKADAAPKTEEAAKVESEPKAMEEAKPAKKGRGRPPKKVAAALAKSSVKPTETPDKTPAKSPAKSTAKPAKSASKTSGSGPAKSPAKSAEKKVEEAAKEEAKPEGPKKGRGRPKKEVVVKSPAEAPPKSPAKSASKSSKPAAEAKSAEEPEPKKAKVEKEKAGTGGVKVGEMLPSIGELESDESTAGAVKKVDVNAVAATSGVVLFFYPKANTGGCTKQACGFNDNFDKLELAGYKIFGMSADRPGTQANWKKKYSFKYTLLSDPSREALKKLGVAKGASSIHRSHIVVEKGGKVLDVKVGVSPGDSVAQAVTTATKT